MILLKAVLKKMPLEGRHIQTLEAVKLACVWAYIDSSRIEIKLIC